MNEVVIVPWTIIQVGRSIIVYYVHKIIFSFFVSKKMMYHLLRCFYGFKVVL